MKTYGLLALAAFAFVSCVKDKPKDVPPPAPVSEAKKVMVVNEGNFGSGNSSISLYDPGNGQVVEDYYYHSNKTQLGDVAQSISKVNGNYYIVVNNSAKIVVCNSAMVKTAQINGLGSPRYLLQVSNQKAYVSDLYANAISIVDLNTRAKTGSIVCKGKLERMLLIFNKVYVTNTERPYLYVIDPMKDQIEDSIYVGTWAASIVSDKNDKLWVLAGGNPPAEPGRLSRINPVTKQVEAFFTFNSSAFPSNLCINKSKDSLYYLNGGVCRFLIHDTALPAQALVKAGTKNFYGLDVSPNDYCIYAADALMYTERSNVYVYGVGGDQKTMFKAGVNANGFYFE